MTRFLLLAPLALIATAAPAKQPAYPKVQAFADSIVKEGKVPGVAIAIGRGDAEPTWITSGRTGFDASAGPATPDTLWRIYSMTKPITGIAAMILVDEGKLRLDQPISDFFPSFAQSRVLTDPAKGTDTRPAKGAITIRMLLTHTSGLNYGITADTPARQQLLRDGIVPFQANSATEAKVRPLRPTTLADFANKAGTTPLVADPGTAWNYAMGLDVLAAVVEKAAGLPFETFVQRRLFTPLGMTSTYWKVPKDQTARFASNYGPRAVVEKAWPDTTTPVTDTVALVDAPASSVYLTAPSFPYGGAGLVSTARDYDRFLHMLANDGRYGRTRILSAKTARLAKSNLLPAAVTLKGFGPIPPNEDTGFGAGGFVTLAAVDAFGRHRGTYGWDGAAGTRAWVDPGRKLRATMMINLLAANAIGAEFDRAIAADITPRTPR